MGYLPVALLGVLAVQLEAALVMTPVDIGLAIAAYWATNAVAAPIVGHRADQHGWAPTGALGVAMSGLILFLLAAAVGSKPTLMLAMAIAGVGLALCSQSSNLTIAREVPWSRQGRAFGLKQTAPPIIAMASGLIVAGIAVPFGWRWAFLTGAVLALPAAVLMTPDLRQHRSNDAVGRPRGDIGVDRCHRPSRDRVGSRPKGSHLAYGYCHHHRYKRRWGRAACRSGSGRRSYRTCDRPHPRLGLAPALYPVVMRYWRQATARTTGFVSIGTSAGASVGPVAFGVIVASRGYSAAWVATGFLSLCAAAFLLAAQRAMTGHGPRTPVPTTIVAIDE